MSAGFDVQKLLSKVPFTTTGIPGELHIPSHHFAGPGTNLSARLNPDDTPQDWSMPVDRDDQAAYYHDLAYRDAGDDIAKKHEADRIMLAQLNAIKNPTLRERIDRLLIKGALNTKLFFGVGVDKEQEANELFKEYRRPPTYLKVKVFEPNAIFSADLVEMPKENLGRLGTYRYALTVIDLYTRYGWAIPLRNKTGNETKQAFMKIFKESKRIPQKLWTDAGREFTNGIMKAFLKDNNIELYHTFNEGKAVVVERFNRTLKQIMWKRFHVQGTQKWVKLLPKVVEYYNNKVHSSIGTTPQNASDHPELIRRAISQTNYENEDNMTKRQLKPKFAVGDHVRMYRYKTHFEKGFTHKYTEEVFKISKIIRSAPTTYEVVDMNNEPILGRFYANELSRVEHKHEI